jgi:putative Mn2+ efflux pump MntP
MSDYIKYKLWKAGIILVIIGIVAFWRGFTGRDDEGDH